MTKKVKINWHVLNDYKKLISEISQLNGLIYHNKSIIKTYLRRVESWDKKRIGKFILGSRFLYNSPYDGRLISGDFYTVSKTNFKDKVSLLERKTNNYFIALAYECFEEFIRSITARIIINNRKTAESINGKLGFSSYKSCLLYLQNQYKNNSNIIGLLRKLSVVLDSSFVKEKGLRNFLNFYRVYTKCRNHIIHTNDVIDINAFKSPEAVDEKFAIRYFGVYANKKGTKYIIDTSDTYKEALETIAGLAYLIISSFDSTIIK